MLRFTSYKEWCEYFWRLIWPKIPKHQILNDHPADLVEILAFPVALNTESGFPSGVLHYFVPENYITDKYNKGASWDDAVAVSPVWSPGHGFVAYHIIYGKITTTEKQKENEEIKYTQAQSCICNNQLKMQTLHHH